MPRSGAGRGEVAHGSDADSFRVVGEVACTGDADCSSRGVGDVARPSSGADDVARRDGGRHSRSVGDVERRDGARPSRGVGDVAGREDARPSRGVSELAPRYAARCSGGVRGVARRDHADPSSSGGGTLTPRVGVRFRHAPRSHGSGAGARPSRARRTNLAVRFIVVSGAGRGGEGTGRDGTGRIFVLDLWGFG